VKAYLALEFFWWKCNVRSTEHLFAEMNSNKPFMDGSSNKANGFVLVKGGHSKSTRLLHLLRRITSVQNQCLEINTFFSHRNIENSETLTFYRRFSTPSLGVDDASFWKCWRMVYKLITRKSLCSKTFKPRVDHLLDPQNLFRQIVFAYIEIIRWLTDFGLLL